MMNQDNPYAMNQTCKVCGEPAAGFHFGAFTCEGCKSFFGRSYNNLSSISDCKNNGECIINKKNRTACKACRLRKCLLVGMSKSGSRYGRRSNWFKIHCLLQEQQQQAAAAMAAAHHSSQQHQHQQQQLAAGGHHSPGAKGGAGPAPGSAAAAAALGMLGHAGAYPGLYPPRSKEELMMLGLEEFAKHPAASPCVSSPDSHTSDSSVELGARGNALLHLAKQHPGDAAAAAAAPHLRKDGLHPFLPLPFPGLASMPVMPPPAFLPPSHLLFPGYHPALYQHHQGLLKPSPEQQQAAAAAVQHLFGGAPTRFGPAAASASSAPSAPGAADPASSNGGPEEERASHANGLQASEEFTKRFYLDAVLKSQRPASPPPATQLPRDHSISALVTPNSESGRARLVSLPSQEGDEDEEAKAPNRGSDDEEDEDLVVSMTPPRSPAAAREATPTADSAPRHSPAPIPTPSDAPAQDDPIDLSMRAGSASSSRSSLDNVPEASAEGRGNGASGAGPWSECGSAEDEENRAVEPVATTILNNNNNGCHHMGVNNNNEEVIELKQHAKRKAEELPEPVGLLLGEREAAEVKRMRPEIGGAAAPTTTPLDLTTKV